MSPKTGVSPQKLRTKVAPEERGNGVYRDGGGQLSSVFCFPCLYGLDG